MSFLNNGVSARGERRERKGSKREGEEEELHGLTLEGMAIGVRGYLVDHVTLGVPMLILTIAIDLDELFENGGLASCTPGGVIDRVVIVAVHLVIVLIV